MQDNFDVHKWNKRRYLKESNESKPKDEFTKAEDKLYKAVTGEEPKVATKNKMREPVKEDQLMASEEEGGIHIVGFNNKDIDSLYLTTSKEDHDEMTSEGPVGSTGVIEDEVTGVKIYWSFGHA